MVRASRAGAWSFIVDARTYVSITSLTLSHECFHWSPLKPAMASRGRHQHPSTACPCWHGPGGRCRRLQAFDVKFCWTICVEVIRKVARAGKENNRLEPVMTYWRPSFDQNKRVSTAKVQHFVDPDMVAVTSETVALRRLPPAYVSSSLVSEGVPPPDRATTM